MSAPNEIKTTLINKIKEDIDIPGDKAIRWRTYQLEDLETEVQMIKPEITIGFWFRETKAKEFIDENAGIIIDIIEDVRLKILGSDYRILLDGQPLEVGDKIAIGERKPLIVASYADGGGVYLNYESGVSNNLPPASYRVLREFGFHRIQKAIGTSNNPSEGGLDDDEEEKRKMTEEQVEQEFDELDLDAELEKLKSENAPIPSKVPDEPEQAVYTTAEGFEAKIEAKFRQLKAKSNITEQDVQDFKNGQIEHTSIGGPKIIEFDRESDPSQKDYLQVEVFKHPSKEMYTVYIKNLENGKIKILTCNHYDETSYHYTNEGANLEIAKVQGNTLESTNPPNKQKFILDENPTIDINTVNYFRGLQDAIPNVSVTDIRQVKNVVSGSDITKVFQRDMALLSR